MTEQWTEIASAGAFAKFTEPGDSYTGVVRNYDPTAGATTFDGDECGFVEIEDDDGEVWRITLDKGALRDPIASAARQRGMDFINSTKMMVEYTTNKESKNGRSYKFFTVKIAPVSGAKATPKVSPSKIRKAVQENLTTATVPDESPF